MKKNAVVIIPIEAVTLAITHSATVLNRSTGSGASFGKLPPNILQ